MKQLSYLAQRCVIGCACAPIGTLVGAAIWVVWYFVTDPGSTPLWNVIGVFVFLAICGGLITFLTSISFGLMVLFALALLGWDSAAVVSLAGGLIGYAIDALNPSNSSTDFTLLYVICGVSSGYFAWVFSRPSRTVEADGPQAARPSP